MSYITRIAIGLLACLVYDVSYAAEKVRAPKGAVYTKLEVEPGKHIHLLEVVNNSNKIAIVAAKSIRLDGQALRGLFLNDYANDSGTRVILSGGYMSSFSPPTALGYLKVGGRQFNQRHTSWLMAGYFCTNGTKHVIEGLNQFESLNKYRDCIQAGPLMIEKGIDKYSLQTALSPGEKKLVEDEQNHAFVCINNSENLVFGFTEEIRLTQLSKWLLEKSKCFSALRLAGSTSAGMKIDKILIGSDDLPLTSVVTMSVK